MPARRRREPGSGDFAFAESVDQNLSARLRCPWRRRKLPDLKPHSSVPKDLRVYPSEELAVLEPARPISPQAPSLLNLPTRPVFLPRGVSSVGHVPIN